MSEKTSIAMEVVGASIANKATVTGAVTGAFGWLIDINWVGLVGVAVAVLGLIANIYFQMRRDHREALASAARESRECAESEARIQALRERCEIGRS